MDSRNIRDVLRIYFKTGVSNILPPSTTRNFYDQYMYHLNSKTKLRDSNFFLKTCLMFNLFTNILFYDVHKSKNNLFLGKS